MGMRYLGKVLRKAGKVVRSCIDNLCCNCPELISDCVCCFGGTVRDTIIAELFYNVSPAYDCATYAPWALSYVDLEFELYRNDSETECCWKGYTGVSGHWATLCYSGCGGVDPGHVDFKIWTDNTETTLVDATSHVVNRVAFTGNCCDEMSRGTGSTTICLAGVRLWPVAEEDEDCGCDDVPESMRVNLTAGYYTTFCHDGIEDYDGVDVDLPLVPNEMWPCRFFGATGVHGQYMEVICSACGNSPRCYTYRAVKIWESSDVEDPRNEIQRWEGYSDVPGDCCVGWYRNNSFFDCISLVEVFPTP